MPDQEKLGTENLKRVIGVGCRFGKQTAAALEDGKFQWTDAFKFVEVAAQLPAAAKSFPHIKKEVLDLDPAEREDVLNYLRTEFDIPNDKLEEAIENAIMWVVSGAAIYEMFKGFKK